ncbi:uncharacterized protein LOC110376046 isoform X2 [Helicoverpa armigera]|uniref:uncharacterized protein LOC110376046 isoform X2 n=1 Tax=Helicoverpa armigera TaxID=29058 RepID=UPI0030836511
MDYVVGSVAALITGNVTPSRPRLLKRALTPTKHQPSPNVTPKSEFVEDRSIFLSPSMQKKKAIVKKSPKRIFQNPDPEATENGEGNTSISSPKADKVKKHLKDDLEADSPNQSLTKSPKNKGNKRDSTTIQEINTSVTEQNVNESTPKKKKKKQNSESDSAQNVSTEPIESTEVTPTGKSPKKNKQRRKSVVDVEANKENDNSETQTTEENTTEQKNTSNITETAQTNNTTPKKKNKKRKKKSKAQTAQNTAIEATENKETTAEETNKENIQKENQVTPKKKNKNSKKSKGPQNKPEIMETDEPVPTENQEESDDEDMDTSKVNPNAITDKESDSEHESDDEIESDNEEINKKVLEEEKADASSDDEEEEEKVEKVEKKEVQKEESGVERITEDEIKRTLFVGNVPFSAKCKKEVKKIFSKHGQIETIRIRTVPIKDGRYTPKLAVIKNELHPERTTVNVYIKYADEASVEKAVSENNTLLNENHLRVSRSSSTGAEHDPRCSVFIGNLPFAMEDEALREKFEKCGAIHSVRIIRDKKTNAGKGFGYVNFESKDGVELALALTEEDLTVKNRILRVKRCTQVTNKKKPVQTGNNQNNQPRGGFKGNNNQFSQQRGGFRNNDNNQQRGGFRNNDGQNNQQRGNFRPGFNRDNQRGDFRSGNNQMNQQRSGPPNRSNQGNSQGNRQRNAMGGGNNQNNQRGGFNKFGAQRNQSQKDDEGREGAHRRIMNKRKNEEAAGGDGPPNKKQKDMSQPREKKTRKEFVGMTAEKKKKRKVDKGQKKKKALSEILTK